MDIIDDDMNVVWGNIKKKADRSTFSTLLAEQRQWLKQREYESNAATEDVAGGSMERYVGALYYVEMSEDRLARLYEIEAGL